MFKDENFEEKFLDDVERVFITEIKARTGFSSAWSLTGVHERTDFLNAIRRQVKLALRKAAPAEPEAKAGGEGGTKGKGSAPNRAEQPDGRAEAEKAKSKPSDQKEEAMPSYPRPKGKE